MSSESLFKRPSAQELFTAELGLNVLLIVFAAATYLGSYNYTATAAFFPRIFSILIIVGSTYIILKHVISTVVVSERMNAMFDTSPRDDEPETDIQKSSAESIRREDVLTSDINPRIVLAILLIAYIFSSYIIGILWTTPFFILAYGLWARQSWQRIVILIGIGVAFSLVFLVLIGTPIESGGL